MVAASFVSKPFISSLFMTFVQFEMCPHHGGLFASLRVPDKLISVTLRSGFIGDTNLWLLTEEPPVPPQSPEAVHGHTQPSGNIPMYSVLHTLPISRPNSR